MEGFRLLALDLDGTTVRRDGSVGRRTLAAVGQARRRGVAVVVATGRTYEAAEAFARRLGADGPIICCDGGLVRDHGYGPVRWAWPIDPDAVRAVCAATEAAGGGWGAYTERGRVFGGAPRPALWRALIRLGRSPRAVWQRLWMDRSQPSRRGPVAPGEDVYKMVAWGLDTSALVARLDGAPLSWPSGVGRRALEIVGAGVSKALALSTLATSLAIPSSSVVAFGDGRNDLEMLEYAGRGVAMANAPEQVQAVARMVTGTVEEEGFARALSLLLAEEDAGCGLATPAARRGMGRPGPGGAGRGEARDG